MPEGFWNLLQGAWKSEIHIELLHWTMTMFSFHSMYFTIVNIWAAFSLNTGCSLQSLRNFWLHFLIYDLVAFLSLSYYKHFITNRQ